MNDRLEHFEKLIDTFEAGICHIIHDCRLLGNAMLLFHHGVLQIFDWIEGIRVTLVRGGLLFEHGQELHHHDLVVNDGLLNNIVDWRLWDHLLAQYGHLCLCLVTLNPEILL